MNEELNKEITKTLKQARIMRLIILITIATGGLIAGILAILGII